MLKNASGTKAAKINYNVKQLPCYSTWKNTTSLTDGYVTGIEPGTNFPNPRTYETENQRVVQLAAGATQAFDVEFEFLSDKASVQKAGGSDVSVRPRKSAKGLRQATARLVR